MIEEILILSTANSNVREVPSNQEVFVDVGMSIEVKLSYNDIITNNCIDSDQSIVIELLELVNNVGDKESAVFHFNTLAEDNEARNHRVLQVNEPEADFVPNFKYECVEKKPFEICLFIWFSLDQNITRSYCLDNKKCLSTMKLPIILSVSVYSFVFVDIFDGFSYTFTLGSSVCGM